MLQTLNSIYLSAYLLKQDFEKLCSVQIISLEFFGL